MPQKERYEVIITSKLNELPIPGMADAIWARIEAQLDLDLPTDDGGDAPVPDNPSGGGILWIGAALLAFVGALFTYFYLQTPQTRSQPQTTIINPVSSTPDTTQMIAIPAQQTAAPKGSLGKQVINNISTIPEERDSAIATPSVVNVILPKEDSVTEVATIHTLPVNQQASDSIPRKKRGLQGLSDKDYRIIPKKD